MHPLATRILMPAHAATSWPTGQPAEHVAAAIAEPGSLGFAIEQLGSAALAAVASVAAALDLW